MVLEEATADQEPAAYSENVPTSDLDPYAGSNAEYLDAKPSSFVRIDQTGAEPLHINLNNLPRRFSILGGRSHNQALVNGINATCTYAGKVIQRPLTQEEADAFAWHWAKSMRTASYGTPFGVTAALIMAGRHSDYRFPGGWKPFKEGSKYSPDKLGPLRGNMARMGWQVLRFNTYGFAGMLLGSLFFASYALTVHAAARATDPRLKAFSDALKESQQGDLRKLASETGREVAQGAQKGETFEMARQRNAAMQRQDASRVRQAAKRRKGDDDNMSPTGGAGFEEDFMQSGSDSGLMSDGQTREQQYRAENANSTYDSDKSTSQQRSNASSSSNASTRQSSQQSGSAWDRLRQNAMSSNPSDPRPTASSSSSQPRRSSSRAEDSFSFSQNDEERQLAKSQAQKDFDAQVEREREGQNFDEGAGKDRRW